MRIAFAEDDRQLRAAVSRGLKEAGYAVDQAGTGSQLLELAGEHTYDAILLDIMLPAPDGIAVCKSLRAAGSRVPILMLTALDAVEKRIAGLDAGADDYLTKPFDFGELLARLRALVRRNADPLGPVISIGGLVIDTRKHAVRRGTRSLALTAKEYALLLYLANNAGRVVNRSELMSRVWGDSRTTYSNIIDVYASRLRKKVDEGEDVQLIATVRGAGFMLSAPEEELSAAGGEKGKAARKRA